MEPRRMRRHSHPTSQFLKLPTPPPIGFTGFPLVFLEKGFWYFGVSIGAADVSKSHKTVSYSCRECVLALRGVDLYNNP